MINRLVPEDDPQLAAWDMLAEITREAEKNLDHSLAPELRGMLVNGDPAQAILQTAQVEKADLIMMPSHDYTFDQLLLGSMTAKVLQGSECSVWTGAHVEESPVQQFAIQRPPQISTKAVTLARVRRAQNSAATCAALCAVDFGPRRHKTAPSCPHFLPAVAVCTRNYQQLPAPPVPRSRCNHC